MSHIGFDATIENIEKLCEIVSAKEISEITIKEEGFELTVKGKKCPPPPPAAMPMPVAMGQAAAPAAAPAAEAAPAAPTVSGNQVKAPIVGTFYAAPSPKDPPFVTVGQQVHKGDVLFIIESMKVMNEIQSEFDGVVKEICVKDAEAVDFDQTVMIIA